jgi:hypothetical protein
VARKKRFTTEIDADVLKRLKTYSALSGSAIKWLVNKYLDEALPPLPAQPECKSEVAA